MGRNPKTGELVRVPEKHVPHLKPGIELRERIKTSGGVTISKRVARSRTTACMVALGTKLPLNLSNRLPERGRSQ